MTRDRIHRIATIAPVILSLLALAVIAAALVFGLERGMKDEGAVAHTAVVPIGGDHFTNDLAVGLHMSVQEAESLKLDYGHCVVTSVPSCSELEFIGGGSVIRTIKQRYLSEILEPRGRDPEVLLHSIARGGWIFSDNRSGDRGMLVQTRAKLLRRQHSQSAGSFQMDT